MHVHLTRIGASSCLIFFIVGLDRISTPNVHGCVLCAVTRKGWGFALDRLFGSDGVEEMCGWESWENVSQ